MRVPGLTCNDPGTRSRAGSRRGVPVGLVLAAAQVGGTFAPPSEVYQED